MPFKKFERESVRYNKFEHAKIIAIVDNDGVVQGYDWTLTQHANDFFADPEDRRKYAAITVRPVTCESMAELQEKFRVALIYLRMGAALATPDAMDTMKSLKEHRGSVEWMHHVNDCGMMIDLDIPEDSTSGLVLRKYAPHQLKVSPRARGKCVEFAHEDLKWCPRLRVVNQLKEAEYKLGDRIQLCTIPEKYSKCKRRRNIWVTVVAGHNHMWMKDNDDFFQDEYIGKKEGDGKLIQFNPKHVLQHLSCAKPESESD